jgi:hypothetical protein
MESTLIWLSAMAALALVTVAATARLIRHDRPVAPPSHTSDDWRAEALSWRRLGIS